MTDKPIKRNIKVHRVNLGQKAQTTLSHPMMQYEEDQAPGRVMGYKIPSWQRPLVWTDAQRLALIENIWRGVDIGTYTYNRMYNSKHDDVLIDGQQRLDAIQRYIEDQFPVYGYLWSELTDVDRRFFDSFHFSCYITEFNREQQLKDHYNMLNFGGTAHTEDQRA